jgi:hypothetical protein
VTVSIVPGLFVAVFTIWRQELVQHARQVLLKAGLELDCADGTSASNVEHVHGADSNTGGVHDLINLVSQIVHLLMPGGLKMNLSLVNHSAFLLKHGHAGQRP